MIFFRHRLASLALSFFVLLSLVSPISSAYAAPAESQPSSTESEQPIQVLGDTVEYFQNEQKAVGTGHVRINYEGVKLEADKITVYMATKKAIAEGHVMLDQKGNVYHSDRVEYDFGKKVGDAQKLDAQIGKDFYLKSEKIEKVSENHLRAVNGSVTTCCGDSPFYMIKSQSIDIFPEDKIVIRNALLYIKGVPVLFVPYYVQPMIDYDRLPVQLVPGKSSEWGAFLLSKWRYNMINQPDLTVKGNILLDYRDRKGFGGGNETFYHGDKVGRGSLRTYFTDDKDTPAGVEDSQRHHIQWRHQSKLTEFTTLTTELNQLSDEFFLKDYFYREQYERNVAPDNYISIITAKPEYTLSILERHRLDNIFTTVNRNPEIRFDTHNRQFADTDFYLREEYQFSSLSREIAHSDEDQNVERMDANHTLSYAGHLGYLAVTPRIGTRQTLYSRDIEGDDPHGRVTVDPGLDVSTRYYKTYDKYINAFGLDYNQIRHIFQPTASYNYRPTPTIRRTDLQQFDFIDAIDKQNIVRLNFENKFQTKQHDLQGQLYSREFARIIPFTDFDFQTGRLENLGLDVELRPYTWLGMESDISYDTRLGKVETANFDVFVEKGPWKIALGQRYLREESSQTTLEVGFHRGDWELKVYERFEFEDNENKEFEVTLSKYWDCVITDFTYNHGDGDTFYFALRLKAFPSTPFGLSQSYNRPKASSRELI